MFKVGETVWVIDSFAGGSDKSECNCCGNVKTKYKKGVKSVVIEAILQDKDEEITYYETYSFWGESEILDDFYPTREAAEAALKETKE